MNNNKEIAHLRASLSDLVAGITAVHQRRRDADADAAALFRAGRHNGIQVKIVKEIVREFEARGIANDVDAIWKIYSEKTGITDADIAADGDNPLDKILDGVGRYQ
jgi:hypothetical protein